MRIIIGLAIAASTLGASTFAANVGGVDIPTTAYVELLERNLPFGGTCAVLLGEVFARDLNVARQMNELIDELAEMASDPRIGPIRSEAQRKRYSEVKVLWERRTHRKFMAFTDLAPMIIKRRHLRLIPNSDMNELRDAQLEIRIAKAVSPELFLAVLEYVLSADPVR